MNSTAPRPIAVTYDNVTLAWEAADGQVYLAPYDSPLDEHGVPTSARWECSRTHWDRYWDSVHSDRFAALESPTPQEADA